MIRIQLDLAKLPVSKQEILAEFLNHFDDDEKNDFIKGLIYLGYITVKQTDLKAIANISRGSKESGQTFRVCLTNPQLIKILDTFEKASNRRNFIYALLYSGLSSFSAFRETFLKKECFDKEVDSIEKNIFLSGLTSQFEKLNNSIIKPRPIQKVTPPKNTISRSQNLKKENSEEINSEQLEVVRLSTKVGNDINVQTLNAIPDATSEDNQKENSTSLINPKPSEPVIAEPDSKGLPHTDVDDKQEQPRKRNPLLAAMKIDAG